MRGKKKNEQRDNSCSNQSAVQYVLLALLACANGQLHSPLSDVSHDLMAYLANKV